MLIGERLYELRKEKGLSQGHIEKRTGLLRCYVSRVENGHTVPSVETLERWARALGVPMYKLFYDGVVPAGVHNFRLETPMPKDTHQVERLRKFLEKMDDRKQQLLLKLAQHMARKNHNGRNLEHERAVRIRRKRGFETAVGQSKSRRAAASA